MKTQRFEVVAGTDEKGDREKFTWDLFPVVDASSTTHLDGNGLAKKGTAVRRGMIVVGKIGKSRHYDESKQPTALEVHGLPFADLNYRYGGMWCDSSLYASREHVGIIKDAWIEEGPPRKAVVLIETV